MRVIRTTMTQPDRQADRARRGAGRRRPSSTAARRAGGQGLLRPRDASPSAMSSTIPRPRRAAIVDSVWDFDEASGRTSFQSADAIVGLCRRARTDRRLAARNPRPCRPSLGRALSPGKARREARHRRGDRHRPGRVRQDFQRRHRIRPRRVAVRPLARRRRRAELGDQSRWSRSTSPATRPPTWPI